MGVEAAVAAMGAAMRLRLVATPISIGVAVLQAIVPKDS